MKSVYSLQYRYLLQLLVEARKRAGLTQQQLATKLKRPQSFVSKMENGERRIDVIEFVRVCRMLATDPNALLRKIEEAE